MNRGGSQLVGDGIQLILKKSRLGTMVVDCVTLISSRKIGRQPIHVQKRGDPYMWLVAPLPDQAVKIVAIGQETRSSAFVNLASLPISARGYHGRINIHAMMAQVRCEQSVDEVGF